MAIRGTTCGHDFDFHLESWMAAAQQWRSGLLYPHWFEPANYGAGEPRFVFYPPISWMFGALLGTILPWAATQVAFTFVILAASGLSMRKLAREWLPAPAATWAACAYILNPYSLFVTYERTAYGELAAGIWLPLIALYALRRKNSILPLALAIAAVWLTNAPAAVMACYFLAAIVLWISIARKQWQPILHSTASLLLGLALSAFYLVPAAYERRWVDIARAIGPDMRVQDSFLFARTGADFHDQVLHTASWIFIVTLAILAVCCATAWMRGAASRRLLPIAATAFAALLLQLPISAPLWAHAPELKFLQFPWRWALVLGIAMALAVAAAFAQSSQNPSPPKFRRRSAALLVAVFAISFAAAHLFRQPCDEYDNIAAQLSVIQAGTGFQGTDEYTALGADNTEIEQELPAVRIVRNFDDEMIDSGKFKVPEDANPTFDPTDRVYAKGQLPARIKIDRWQSETKVFHVNSPAAGYAILRLMDYPAWRVLTNGSPAAGRPRRDDGLMAVPVPAGMTRVEIHYAATADVLWGRALTAAAVLLLLALAASQKRNRVGYHG